MMMMMMKKKMVGKHAYNRRWNEPLLHSFERLANKAEIFSFNI